MSKKKEEIDYEKLYYQLKKEVAILSKNSKVVIEFTIQEINLLTNIMYEELHHLKDRTFFTEEDPEDEDDPMHKLKAKKDVLLCTMIDEQKAMMENIIKKLRLEEWSSANSEGIDVDFAIWCAENYKRVDDNWEQGGVKFTSAELKQIYLRK